jgi:hypothetical protein
MPIRPSRVNTGMTMNSAVTLGRPSAAPNT